MFLLYFSSISSFSLLHRDERWARANSTSTALEGKTRTSASHSWAYRSVHGGAYSGDHARFCVATRSSVATAYEAVATEEYESENGGSGSEGREEEGGIRGEEDCV